MAEVHKNLAKKLVEIFLKEYNKSHKTKFKWDDDRSYLPNDKGYFDFIVFDGDKELGIQHTYAVADEKREFALPAAVEKVLVPLKQKLMDNPNVPSLHISINFSNPPSTKKEEDDALYWLDFFITEKVVHPLSLSYFDYDEDFDDQYLSRIKKYVNRITLLPLITPKDHKDIVFGYGWSKDGTEPWIDEAQSVNKAIDKKEYDCRETLLLIQMGTPSVPFRVEEMKKHVKTKNMGEIWIVEPFLQREKAIRIK